MRIWLRPDKLAKLGLTPSDVIVGHQGAEPAGAGRPHRRARPRPKDQEFTYTVSAPGRLVTADGVREHHHPRDRDGRARSASRTSAASSSGSQDYDSFGRLERQAAGAMARLPPARAPISSRPRRRSTRRMRRAKELFPSDMDYKIVYDTTPAVEASIESIVHTFVEAIILVTLVVFIFLQNLRATHHSAADRAGVADRHVHLLSAARLLAQHAFDVRPRARDRHRRRRRHRRGRGGHAPHRARHEPRRTRPSRR